MSKYTSIVAGFYERTTIIYIAILSLCVLGFATISNPAAAQQSEADSRAPLVGELSISQDQIRALREASNLELAQQELSRAALTDSYLQSLTLVSPEQRLQAILSHPSFKGAIALSPIEVQNTVDPGTDHSTPTDTQPADDLAVLLSGQSTQADLNACQASVEELSARIDQLESQIDGQ